MRIGLACDLWRVQPVFPAANDLPISSMSHGSIHCFGHFPSFFVCLPEVTPWQERSDEDRPLDFQAPASLQGREQLSGKGHWMLDDGCHFLPKTDEKCPV